MPSWPEIQAGIFAGESGGDYNALFGYSNRPGKQFAGTNLTGMTVDQAIQFADPNGPYAQWVRGQIGRTATPMGAYQVVGSTLQQAKKWAGLKGDELMTPEIQDRIGQAILANQGTGAWEGYRGPQQPGLATASAPAGDVGGLGRGAIMEAQQAPATPNYGAATPQVSQYGLKPEKTKRKSWNQTLGEGIAGLAGSEAPRVGMGQAPQSEPFELTGGSPTPSVYRAPFQPQQAPMPGGGMDLRAMLAQLMGQGGQRA